MQHKKHHDRFIHTPTKTIPTHTHPSQTSHSPEPKENYQNYLLKEMFQPLSLANNL